jgi:cytochrome c2
MHNSGRGIFAHGLPWGAGAGLIALAFGGLLTVAPFQAKGQDMQSGQALFEKRCTGCHALDGDHEGPRLRGVVGRMSGAVKTFKYSSALEKAGITWDAEKLDKWLTDPDSLVPDNDMSFRVPKQEERALIIAYLKSIH